MKDAVHHLKFVQRKVIQSARKELLSNNSTSHSDELVKSAAIGFEDRFEQAPKRTRNNKRFMNRKPSGTRVH